MASLQPFWDFVVILSLLKFLKLSTFFKYLQTHLVGRNWSNYLIKIVRVGVRMFSFRCEVEFWVGRCHEVDLIYCFGEFKLHSTRLQTQNRAQTSIKRLITSSLPLQNILSIIFLYHFLVCFNFVLMRVFPAPESFRHSMTSSTFWTSTSDCKLIRERATGCYRTLHRLFSLNFLSRYRVRKNLIALSGEVHHLLLLHHLHSHAFCQQCGGEEPS